MKCWIAIPRLCLLQIPLVVLTFVILLAGFSRTEGQTSAGEVDCSQGGRTQTEMSICVQQTAESAVGKLDALLKELRGVLPGTRRTELNAIQQSWTRLRDRQCAWESAFFSGGSVAALVHGNCVLEVTKARIERLRRFLCEGQGVTGECPASEKYK